MALLMSLLALLLSSNHYSYASAFGPGLYGNTMYCGGTLNEGTIAVAHRSLPCNTKIKIHYGHKTVIARVRDRGPFVSGRDLDLTEGLTWKLCYCHARRWGVRQVHWRVVR